MIRTPVKIFMVFWLCFVPVIVVKVRFVKKFNSYLVVIDML